MKEGFVTSAIVLVIVGILVVGLAVFAYFQFKPKESTQTQEVSINQESTSSPNTQPTNADETANWKTYTNTQYGYSIKYPQDMIINTRKIEEAQEDITENNLEGKVVDLLGFSSNPSRPERISIEITSTTEVSSPLKNYAEKIAANPNHLEQTFEEVNIGGVLGYRITWPGVYASIVLLPNTRTNTILSIGVHSTTTDQTAKKIFSQIISTFKFE